MCSAHLDLCAWSRIPIMSPFQRLRGIRQGLINRCMLSLLLTKGVMPSEPRRPLSDVSGLPTAVSLEGLEHMEGLLLCVLRSYEH